MYLAIKIRSTDELDNINEQNLKKEKTNLMQHVDCFQILEYIRSSIEIIMNLKIDDLEKNDNNNNARKLDKSGEKSELQETSISGISIES